MNFKLCKLHNLEKGKRCFILANGPSINSHNLSLLKNEIVISINASPILENKFNFKSKYYCLSDPRFLEVQHKKEIFLKKMDDDTTIFCRENFYDVLTDNNIDPSKIIFLNSRGRDGFSKNLHKGFFFGSSTTHMALQLAYWLGCKEVYILGLDLIYPSNSKSYRFYKEDITQTYDYLVSIQLHNYIEAKTIFNTENKHIYICNKKSWALPYIEYKNYEETFNV